MGIYAILFTRSIFKKALVLSAMRAHITRCELELWSDQEIVEACMEALPLFELDASDGY